MRTYVTQTVDYFAAHVFPRDDTRFSVSSVTDLLNFDLYSETTFRQLYMASCSSIAHASCTWHLVHLIARATKVA